MRSFWKVGRISGETGPLGVLWARASAGLAGLVTAVLVCGCGGGGSAAAPTTALPSGRVHLSVQFPPALTRQLAPGAIPEGTNSIRVSLTDTNDAPLAQPVLVARPAGSTLASVDFSQVAAGTVNVTATAYSDYAGTTSPLAVGSASGTLTPGGTLDLSVPLTLQISGITLDHTGSVPLTLSGNPDITLTAQVTDSSGAKLSGLPLDWSTSNGAVATVTPLPGSLDQATVSAVSPGQATITVTERNTGQAASVLVQVTPS